jgi:hypothetical protein
MGSSVFFFPVIDLSNGMPVYIQVKAEITQGYLYN